MSTPVKNLTSAPTATRDSLQLQILGVLTITSFLCSRGSGAKFSEMGLFFMLSKHWSTNLHFSEHICVLKRAPDSTHWKDGIPMQDMSNKV